MENENKKIINEAPEELTFEELLSIPEFKKEFDRKVSKAINTYESNAKKDGIIMSKEEIEKIKNEHTNQMKELKFELALTKEINKIGTIDEIGFKAHLDMEKLKQSFDEEKNTISEFTEMAELIKNQQQHLFTNNKSQGNKIDGFVVNKNEPTDLHSALREKFGNIGGNN